MNTTISLKALLSATHEISERAGEIIRSVFEESKGKVPAADKTKGETALNSSSSSTNVEDPQTIADIRAQKLLVGSLEQAFPGLKIVGEEGKLEIDKDDIYSPKLTHFDSISFPKEYEHLSLQDLTVWIDPLDGTKEFTQGLKQYVTVLIGVSYRGSALAGVVHIPFAKEIAINKYEGRTIWGCVGVGVYGIDVATKPNASRRIMTTSKTHFTGPLKELADSKHYETLVFAGGAGSKALLLLEGIVDVYFFPLQATKKWDTCAVHALIKAIGGSFTDAYGHEIEYNSKSSTYFNSNGIIASLCNHDSWLLTSKQRSL